jgi:fructokinase
VARAKSIDIRFATPDTCLAVPTVQTENGNLYSQDGTNGHPIVVLGEVLWDDFEHSRRLGGAPLNFAAHASRLGHDALLISAVGADLLGEEAFEAIRGLGLSTAFLQKAARFHTGTARVHPRPDGQTRFVIERPAAYDAVSISDREIERIVSQAPEWLYCGTLFASNSMGEASLNRLLHALPAAERFYDLNLRPDCYSAALVARLLRIANVVKLNE